MEQEDYIADLKKYMLKRSVDGYIGEETLIGYPVLSYCDKEKPLRFSVMVVKDGAGYYEITYCCFKPLYDKYKAEAFKVFRSFEVLRHANERLPIRRTEFFRNLSIGSILKVLGSMILSKGQLFTP